VPTDELPANWVVMRLRGLIVDPNSDAPVVILREAEEGIFLPIWIGPFEANAIAMAAEGVEPPRPMTHDLLRSVLETLEATLVRVEIFALLEGTFHARLIVASREGERREVDARPSDALALAVRVDAPIWAARDVLDSALRTSRAATESDEEKLREWLANASAEDLGKYSM
jgi:bifunctional DNase/RNase